MDALSPTAYFHIRVIFHTIVALITIACISVGIFLFVSGSQILESNRERAGVRLQRTVVDNETRVAGTFAARSDCTKVEVTTAVEAQHPTIYLTEHEDSFCALYQNPQPYTFTVVFDGRFAAPMRVFVNGDALATIEE